MRNQRILSGTAIMAMAGGLFAAPSPAMAATLAGTEQVWQGGDWAVEATPYWCRAYPVAAEKNADGIPEVALIQWDGKAYLEFVSAPETEHFSREISISTLIIDGLRHDVLTQHYSGRVWEAGIINENTIAAITRGQQLKGQLDGKNLTSHSLKGSANSIVALDECANNLVASGNMGLDPLKRLKPNQKLQPKGNPGNWVPQSAYPRGPHTNFEGTVGFTLTVGPDGRPTKCEVTNSSGNIELDRAACSNLMKRAKFGAATDAYGYPIASEYSNKVRWVIPK
jgi:TonB family protein